MSEASSLLSAPHRQAIQADVMSFLFMQVVYKQLAAQLGLPVHQVNEVMAASTVRTAEVKHLKAAEVTAAADNDESDVVLIPVSQGSSWWGQVPRTAWSWSLGKSKWIKKASPFNLTASGTILVNQNTYSTEENIWVSCWLPLQTWQMDISVPQFVHVAMSALQGMPFVMHADVVYQ